MVDITLLPKEVSYAPQATDVDQSSQIIEDVNKALNLIDIGKEKETADTKKKMEDLLIEYILANTKGDLEAAKSIQGQMDKLSSAYGSDMEHANELRGKLERMKGNPNMDQSKELTYLQNLITALHQDAGSGDMSNLVTYDQALNGNGTFIDG